MKILDKYIIKKFLSTFIFFVLILTTVVIVLDISDKGGRISDNGSSVAEALVKFYPFWGIWLVNTFISIAVFVSVIFFTSKLANNTEIVAMTTGGISFQRLTRPFLFVGGLIALFSLVTNHYVLPWANKKKNDYMFEFIEGHEKKRKNKSYKVSAQISKDEYIFMSNFSLSSSRGKNFNYQKFDSLSIVENIWARQIAWEKKDSTYNLYSCYQIFAKNGKRDSVLYKPSLKRKFDIRPDELLPESYIAEIMNSSELIRFIKREKIKGSKSTPVYVSELHKRTSLPVSAIILTILALTLSSRKKRGGLGVDLAVGVSIAFVFVFINQTTGTLAETEVMSPFWSAWFANIVFGVVTIFLYIKRVLNI